MVEIVPEGGVELEIELDFLEVVPEGGEELEIDFESKEVDLDFEPEEAELEFELEPEEAELEFEPEEAGLDHHWNWSCRRLNHRYWDLQRWRHQLRRGPKPKVETKQLERERDSWPIL
jgi:hypothetical protein